MELAAPLQSWRAVSGLDAEQSASLQRSLNDGSEYLAGGYAEALTLNPYGADARRGARDALGKLRSELTPEQYRKYLISQREEERNPAWLKVRVEAELGSKP